MWFSIIKTFNTAQLICIKQLLTLSDAVIDATDCDINRVIRNIYSIQLHINLSDTPVSQAVVQQVNILIIKSLV